MNIHPFDAVSAWDESAEAKGRPTVAQLSGLVSHRPVPEPEPVTCPPVSSRRETLAVRTGGFITALGVIVSWAPSNVPVLLTGLSLLVTGVGVVFRFGVVTGRWER